MKFGNSHWHIRLMRSWTETKIILDMQGVQPGGSKVIPDPVTYGESKVSAVSTPIISLYVKHSTPLAFDKELNLYVPLCSLSRKTC